MDSDNQIPTKSVKEQSKSETKRRIILAGVKAFSRYGYHGMKIAAVARDAGVANGTFYLHFKDKQTLFLEIVRSAVAKLASGLFAVHNYGSKVNADRDEIKVTLKFAEENKDLMRVALDFKAADVSGNTDIFAPLIDMRVEEIKSAVKEGRIIHSINPVVAARAEIGMITSVIHWWLDHREEVSRNDLLDTLTHLRRSWMSPNTDIDDIDSLLNQWDSRL